MDRFVILTHDYPTMHWDLLLETGDLCRTWRLADEPSPGQENVAEQIADHRRKYLSYEGPVSGDRGNVVRWDFGSYRMISDTADEIVFNLSGQRFHGKCRLHRITGTSWQAVFHCDENWKSNDD